ncbi:hypothetical protein [Fictibacillus phosphorivorans]|uniref:hypothetical protein n=1 Tax=Fictibacillus phosphorivorans TaxID=1221500 RepID=UPI001293A969|nr:hypothetical protein [Fictibacillus phosphorivorans]MQR94895.1 hypothetical protein [Fictibacillus phosphorivorans]
MKISRKNIFILSLLFFISFVIYEFLYDPFPVKQVNHVQVMKMVDQADGNMIRIPSHYQGYQWYMSKKKNADENIERHLKEKGWTLTKKEDQSYFFEGVQGNIIVNSDIWKKNYTIFRFPEGI